MVTVVLAVIIALGIINTKTSSHLSSMQQTVSNLTHVVQSLSAAVLHSDDEELCHLQLSVDQNKNQLISGTAGDMCCPLAWERLGSSCYFFSSSVLSWEESRDWCRGQEAHLVILNTEEEWDFVVKHTHGVLYWVGLSIGKTGSWEWSNQTPYVMERRRWKPGQPDRWTGHGLGTGSEDCVNLGTNGRLNDLHCSTKLPYICQKHSVHS
ncbi:C-type lectin domain family 10 member A-like isoform X1 [Thalassophryne amazonica]|uniref:C-type lectin domain family 10 member A-like isoform X1 n=1 Tax=Thalassophryne amazonica TaxID=390379 RepID=UPI0014725F16|nr:C-type lectin domain family 10 member A-like isoform X1 [Thalassophryne amazonica]